MLTPFVKDLLASYDVTGQITAIENMIAQGADMQIILRLLCLASITAGGIKAKSLENIKREILQVCILRSISLPDSRDCSRHTATISYPFFSRSRHLLCRYSCQIPCQHQHPRPSYHPNTHSHLSVNLSAFS